MSFYHKPHTHGFTIDKENNVFIDNEFDGCAKVKLKKRIIYDKFKRKNKRKTEKENETCD